MFIVYNIYKITQQHFTVWLLNDVVKSHHHWNTSRAYNAGRGSQHAGSTVTELYGNGVWSAKKAVDSDW